MTALLIVLAIGFAWSIGAHYTGAFLGATFASHGVEQRVGSGLTAVPLSVERQVVVIGVAFAVTTFFNRFRMPTTTIQILVFSIIGVSLATGIGVNWGAIGHLVIVWAVAPVAAIFLGYLLTLGLDRLRLGERIGAMLVAMGAVAAFAMGANDVSNASGALVGTGTFSPLAAGAVGGAGIAIGVLTWGKPLLRRVAFEIVEVDRPMATAAQLVQAGVVLAAVGRRRRAPHAAGATAPAARPLLPGREVARPAARGSRPPRRPRPLPPPAPG